MNDQPPTPNFKDPATNDTKFNQNINLEFQRLMAQREQLIAPSGNRIIPPDEEKPDPAFEKQYGNLLPPDAQERMNSLLVNGLSVKLSSRSDPK